MRALVRLLAAGTGRFPGIFEPRHAKSTDFGRLRTARALASLRSRCIWLNERPSSIRCAETRNRCSYFMRDKKMQRYRDVSSWCVHKSEVREHGDNVTQWTLRNESEESVAA